MSSTALQITFLSSLLIAAAVLGQGVIGRTDTIVSGGHRIDANTDGVVSVMPKSLHDDLVLWQTFSYSDNSDADFYDLSVSGNDGAQTAAAQQPTFSTSSGGHYDFDGVDDYIDITNSASLSITGDLTLMVWIYRSVGDADTSSDMIVAKRDSDSTGYQFYKGSTGANNLMSFYDGSVTVKANTAMTQNTWYHMAVVVDSGATDGTTHYRNGVDDGDGTTTITSDDSDVYIGWLELGGAFHWPGRIDDARIFNRVLTSNEVFNVYNNTKATYGL